jgi:sulfatase maturation enzyme AslB (radical SAM superfamily)
MKSLFQSIFDEPHDEEIIMTFDGEGEIFFSSVYREIFETEYVFHNLDKWPGFKVILCTNGTMMTEKIQEQYRPMFNRAAQVSISIDAGNQSAYEKVRRGGDWSLLWDNINYLYKTTLKNDTSKVWAWNLILQDDNFETLPELIRLAYNYPDNLPHIYITNVLNWGVWSVEEYNNKAVWLPTAPRHSMLKEVLSLPEVNNYPRIFKPLL